MPYSLHRIDSSRLYFVYTVGFLHPDSTEVVDQQRRYPATLPRSERVPAIPVPTLRAGAGTLVPTPVPTATGAMNMEQESSATSDTVTAMVTEAMRPCVISVLQVGGNTEADQDQLIREQKAKRKPEGFVLLYSSAITTTGADEAARWTRVGSNGIQWRRETSLTP